MPPIRAPFTVRGLVLANLIVGVVLAWLVSMCDGDIYHFDGRKMALSVAIVFGLPALVILLGSRGPRVDRRLAFRAGLGLHCAIMAILCSVPILFWLLGLAHRGGRLSPIEWKYLRWTCGPSAAMVILYVLAFSLARWGVSGGRSPRATQERRPALHPAWHSDPAGR
jgi:hypothetical protein